MFVYTKGQTPLVGKIWPVSVVVKENWGPQEQEVLQLWDGSRRLHSPRVEQLIDQIFQKTKTSKQMIAPLITVHFVPIPLSLWVKREFVRPRILLDSCPGRRKIDGERPLLLNTKQQNAEQQKGSAGWTKRLPQAVGLAWPEFSGLFSSWRSRYSEWGLVMAEREQQEAGSQGFWWHHRKWHHPSLVCGLRSWKASQEVGPSGMWGLMSLGAEV